MESSCQVHQERRCQYRLWCFGDGPRDIVLVPGTASHVELMWEVPASEYMLGRLTSFARVIVFDQRGQGLSDRSPTRSLWKNGSMVSGR